MTTYIKNGLHKFDVNNKLYFHADKEGLCQSRHI